MKREEILKKERKKIKTEKNPSLMQKEEKNVQKAQALADKKAQRQAQSAAKKQLTLQKKQHRQQMQVEKSEKKLALQLEKKKKELSPDEILKKQLQAHASQQDFTKAGWHKLDNAGLIFPAVDKKGLKTCYRLGVLLNDPVQPIVLQEAINDIAPRFSSMTATIKKGFFWCYLDSPSKPITLEKQEGMPNLKLRVNGKHSMIRISYYNREISVHFFHTATDGTGGITFLNSLLARYFTLLGEKIEDKTNIRNFKDKVMLEEVDDAYQKFSGKVEGAKKDDEKKTYKIKGEIVSRDSLYLVKGTMSASKVKEIAKQYNLTITQFLTTCLIDAVQKTREFYCDERKHPITITPAVNLRNFFPTESLRNFASYLSITEKDATNFEELAKVVKQQFEEKLNADYFRTRVHFNVSAQRNLFVKFLPLAVKNLAFNIAFALMSDKARTMPLSNLGLVKAPEEFKDKIARYEMSFSSPDKGKYMCAAVSYNDTLCFTFSKNIKDSLVEKEFFKKLASLGIEVAVESTMEAT